MKTSKTATATKGAPAPLTNKIVNGSDLKAAVADKMKAAANYSDDLNNVIEAAEAAAEKPAPTGEKKSSDTNAISNGQGKKGSIAKAEAAPTLTVSHSQAPVKSVDKVLANLAELKKAEQIYNTINERISDLMQMSFEEGNRDQSLIIKDTKGREFKTYADGFLKIVVSVLLEQAQARKLEAENYLINAEL
jgi:hypothetical protein